MCEILSPSIYSPARCSAWAQVIGPLLVSEESYKRIEKSVYYSDTLRQFQDRQTGRHSRKMAKCLKNSCYIHTASVKEFI
jgi:hypothetical protein